MKFRTSAVAALLKFRLISWVGSVACIVSGTLMAVAGARNTLAAVSLTENDKRDGSDALPSLGNGVTFSHSEMTIT
jgi:hypothetical protein